MSGIGKMLMAVLLHVFVLEKVEAAPCPSVCRCSVDHHGRSTVTCLQGNMRDVIPVFDMAHDTKVLIITAPPFRENYLSLGPIFQGLRSLEEIQISRSGIPNLGEHSFWGLHNLEVLNLTWNHLTSLRDTNFKGAKSLKSLDLSHNRIESVPSAAFRHVRQLRYLSLADNKVPELVPRIFFGLTQLEFLDLSHNPLGKFDPDIFTDISLLRSLKCAECHLTTISRSLLSMISDLRVLDLSGNKITQVPDLNNAVPYLVSLQLDNNLISFVYKFTLVNSRLTHLHLAHNRIVRVEANAFQNASLSHLDLMYNRLTYLNPNGIQATLNELKVLKLSGNPLNLAELNKTLFQSKKLHELGLGDVGLSILPSDLLLHNSNLRHLNLSANYLTSLPMELFITCPNLQVLDLSSNSYKGLSSEILEGLSEAEHLRVLRLQGNPWICDQCHVSPLVRWLHGAPDQESGCLEPKVWTCLKCLGPPRFAGLELALLPPGDLPPCENFHTFPPPTFRFQPTERINNFSLVVQAEFPRGELTRQNTANIDHADPNLIDLETPWTITDLIQDRFYTIIIASCVFFVCLLFLVMIAAFAYHRQTAFYYTNEHEMSTTATRETSLEQQPKLVKNNNNKSHKKLQKKASIATIEEVRCISGSTELADGIVPPAEDGDINDAKLDGSEEQITVSQSTRDTYQTVVDELGRTKLCKSNSKPHIPILDAEPRPGKG